MLRLIAIAATALSLALPAFAVEMGDDGLHKPTWFHDTFKDLREDLAEANSEGKRVILMVEQRGCIYCTEMHEKTYPDPEIDAMLREKYFPIQINLFGATEVTDFDGKVLTEKEAARRWGVVFTPTLIFLPEEVPEGQSAGQAAVMTMPGAFGVGTTKLMLEWVLEHGYQSGEMFQEYIQKRIQSN